MSASDGQTLRDVFAAELRRTFFGGNRLVVSGILAVFLLFNWALGFVFDLLDSSAGDAVSTPGFTSAMAGVFSCLAFYLCALCAVTQAQECKDKTLDLALSFAPQRRRLVTARLGAWVAFSFAILLASLVLALLVLVSARMATVGGRGVDVGSFVPVAVSCLLAGCLLTAIGFGIGMALRRTWAVTLVMLAFFGGPIIYTTLQVALPEMLKVSLSMLMRALPLDAFMEATLTPVAALAGWEPLAWGWIKLLLWAAGSLLWAYGVFACKSRRERVALPSAAAAMLVCAVVIAGVCNNIVFYSISFGAAGLYSSEDFVGVVRTQPAARSQVDAREAIAGLKRFSVQGVESGTSWLSAGEDGGFELSARVVGTSTWRNKAGETCYDAQAIVRENVGGVRVTHTVPLVVTPATTLRVTGHEIAPELREKLVSVLPGGQAQLRFTVEDGWLRATSVDISMTDQFWVFGLGGFGKDWGMLYDSVSFGTVYYDSLESDTAIAANWNDPLWMQLTADGVDWLEGLSDAYSETMDLGAERRGTFVFTKPDLLGGAVVYHTVRVDYDEVRPYDDDDEDMDDEDVDELERFGITLRDGKPYLSAYEKVPFSD